jgi:hypothetical protein
MLLLTLLAYAMLQIRFAFMPCGHCFCGHATCYSSKVSECPTCRGQFTGRQELFGACTWLADMLETVDSGKSCVPTQQDCMSRTASEFGTDARYKKIASKFEVLSTRAEEVTRFV